MVSVGGLKTKTANGRAALYSCVIRVSIGIFATDDADGKNTICGWCITSPALIEILNAARMLHHCYMDHPERKIPDAGCDSVRALALGR